MTTFSNGKDSTPFAD